MNPPKGLVSLRPVDGADLPIFFTHQLDPEATRLAGFLAREREAFVTMHVSGPGLEVGTPR